MKNYKCNGCLLGHKCKQRGKVELFCPHKVALHGVNGKGGRVGSSNVPTDYQGVLLSNSPVANDQAQIYKMLGQYVGTFERQFPEVADQYFSYLLECGHDEATADRKARIKSLYLWSEASGTGKTTTACAVLNEWLIASYIGALTRGKQAPQVPAYFLDVNALQNDYNQFNRPRVPESIAEEASARYYKALSLASKAPFAVLDDIGVRGCTEAFRADLHAVINERVTQHRPTVYTSNLPLRYQGDKNPARMPYDLVDVFGEERLVDRVSDLCCVLHFSGTSKRGKA